MTDDMPMDPVPMSEVEAVTPVVLGDVFSTIIVPAPQQAEAQAIAAEYPGGAGMFETGCSPTGEAPATDYISSGYINGGIPVALAAAIPDADISEESPFVALERLGLQIVYEVDALADEVPSGD